MSPSRTSNIATTVNEKTVGAVSYAQRSLDRFVPPASRQRAYDSTSAFAAARPILFAFAVSQFLFSFVPLLLFVTFALSTVAFALGVAVIFALFWIGVAFMLLVPTLIVTSCIAVLVWAWAVGSFVVARWLYNHAPFGVQGDLQLDAGGKRYEVIKNEKGVDGQVNNGY